MDERQRQIREGAGLEESKLNVEFIDWLKKWGPYFLITLAVVVLVWRGTEFLKQRRQQTVDKAFIEYRQLTEALLFTGELNTSPESFIQFAEAHKRTPGLASEASLEAARIFMRAVSVGVEPGARMQADGSYAETDLLTDARREQLVGRARDLYAIVLEATEGKIGMDLLAVQAAFGLAAAGEALERWDEASGWYDRAIAIADAARFIELSALASERKEGLAKLKSLPRLYAQAELPRRPEPLLDSGFDLQQWFPDVPPDLAPEADSGTTDDPDGDTPPEAGAADDPATPPEGN
ncbi:MAG: hypothetical protein KF866_07280 [Phycisphaeraceae bacterium]|nr:hypothetical protein [Phycisphaeraceae bacterium]